MMAVGCLMIETLESFRLGILNTQGHSKEMFDSFFQTEESLFPDFKNIKRFYKDIRCGILHQAETTNAWRIILYGPIVDKEKRTINAEKFIEALQAALEKYKHDLEVNDFDTAIWRNVFFKLDDICNNCSVSHPV